VVGTGRDNGSDAAVLAMTGAGTLASGNSTLTVDIEDPERTAICPPQSV